MGDIEQELTSQELEEVCMSLKLEIGDRVKVKNIY